MSDNPVSSLSDNAGLAAQQAGFWAHWLTLDSGTDDALAQSVAGAKVDLNPHQVEAALFALRSPLWHGAMLADEVGLGKTIEASLVLAQHWAERRRRLLLVVPATLRKQWSQELEEKFSLPNRIVEARTLREAPDALGGEPAAIAICSYEFAARQHAALAAVRWDLAVFDEAHKLRNFYRLGEGSAKIARRLFDALQSVPKLLLSATPLQNNLAELYGLVSFMDPHFFGSLDAFRARYGTGGGAHLDELRGRLRPIITRTLRRQVQQEGGISFTRRYSLTEDFTPSDDEIELYHAVSDYLQDDAQLAFAPRSRHLVTLVVRKILASSSRAIAGTLDTMIRRLEARAELDAEALAGEFDGVDDLEDAEGSDANAPADEPTAASSAEAAALQFEIARLHDFRQLARRIQLDRKAAALLAVLGRAFEMTERLGGARKAVIFTESVRTQAWLAELLDAQPASRGRVVLLNGSNADASSRAIYMAWTQRHADSSRIGGSRSADMKAALVDRFRELGGDAVLLCTEAGAEGINLQFCSLLVNYDLPWNPQRVEQRIGRVHRYGQKHDVVVVNFVNRANLADRRVFELLNEKFKLFEGVFGASDEVLGAIESGIDLEKRILAIYQQCRNDAQIAAEFDALQASLRAPLEERDAQVRRALLDHFDADVVERLRLRRVRAGQVLDRYQQHLYALARARHPQARVDDAGRIEIDGRWHDVQWPRAEASEAAFLRPSAGLGLQLIDDAKAVLAEQPDADLTLVYTPSSGGQWSDLRRLIGMDGELAVDLLEAASPESRRERLLVAARTDRGDVLDTATCERLLSLPASRDTGGARALGRAPPHGLQALLDARAEEALAAIDHANATAFDAEADKLERWAEDRRMAHELRVKALDAQVAGARRELRQRISLQDKVEGRRELTRLERERDETMLTWHAARQQIESEQDRLLRDAEARLALTVTRRRLTTLRWSLRARSDHTSAAPTAHQGTSATSLQVEAAP